MNQGTADACARQDAGFANSGSEMLRLLERMAVALEALAGAKVKPSAPRKPKRLASEIERHEREQRAIMFLKQLGPNKTAIADALGWSRATLDNMPLFCEMFELMAQPGSGPAISDQSDSEGRRQKRYRRDRSSD